VADPSAGDPQNAPGLGGSLGTAPDDLQARLNLAALEKTELEKKELSLRIGDLLNWKRKWAQLAISLLVPIATAAIALFAAYVELRSVRNEREQLATEKQTLEREKAADYAATKVNHAIDILRQKESSPLSTQIAVLDALQNLLLGEAKLPESSVEIIFHYVMDPDDRVSGVARAILNTSKLPTYARLLTSTLIAPTPPVQYNIAHLITETQFESKNIAYIAPLVNANDSAVAGDAMRAVSKDYGIPLNMLIHLDDGSSEHERMTYLVTSLIISNKEIRRSSLKFMADRLLSDKTFDISSDEFYSACAVNQKGEAYTESVLGRDDLSDANKLLLGITLPRSKRQPFAALAQKIVAGPKETVKLLLQLGNLDFILSALGVAKPKFIIDDFTKYRPEELLKLARYIDFDSVSHSKLIKLRDDLKSIGYNSPEIIDAIVKQDAYDLNAVQNDGIDIGAYISLAAGSSDKKLIDSAFDLFVDSNKKNIRSLSLRAYVQIAANLVKAGKPDSLFDKLYVLYPIEFLFNLDIVARVDRFYATRFLRKLLNTHELTPLQVVMLSFRAGIDSDFSASAQEAFDETLRDISSIDQAELRQNPDSQREDVDRALVALSLLTKSAYFKQDVAKLRVAVVTLGLIPARGSGTSMFVEDLFQDIEIGDAYARLIQSLSPDLADRVNVTGCDGLVHDKVMETDQMKHLVWSAIMN
jgi:hypothetical protein